MIDFFEVHSWTPFSLCTLYLRKLIHSHEFKYNFYASNLSVAQVCVLSSKNKLLTYHVVTTVCITDISNSVCPKLFPSPSPGTHPFLQTQELRPEPWESLWCLPHPHESIAKSS